MTATFTEEWFDQKSQENLLFLLSKVRDLEGAVIEVGCWEGRSTALIANSVYPERVFAVDTWKGSPNHACFFTAMERDVRGIFLQNMHDLTDGNVEPWQMDWREFFEDWQGPIKFIHIDADHSFKEVRDNIDVAMPYMVKGGIMCGHDMDESGVYAGVVASLDHVTVSGKTWYKVM